MKLFYSPGACSMAPHIALLEANAKCDYVKVDLAKKQYDGTKDYRTINPKGTVPAIQLGNGDVLTEVAVILQYIADHHPDANLIAKPGTMERYHTLEWLNFIATELHKGFGPLFKPNTPDEYKKITVENLKTRFAFVSDRLEGGHYIMGKTYTVADPYLFTVLNWAHVHHLDLTPWPHILGFMERMKGRQPTLDAMMQEGLL